MLNRLFRYQFLLMSKVNVIRDQKSEKEGLQTSRIRQNLENRVNWVPFARGQGQSQLSRDTPAPKNQKLSQNDSFPHF